MSSLVRRAGLCALILAMPFSGGPAHAAPAAHDRWMVGAINDARQAEGLPRLVISGSLSRAARDYAAYLRERRHYAHVDQEGRHPFERAMVAGWPSNQAWEVLNKGEDFALVFETWMASATHRAILMSPAVDSIGVARDPVAGYYWVGLVGHCPADRPPACELAGDTGDAGLALEATTTRDPRLRAALHRTGRQLEVRVQARGDGQLKVCIRRAGRAGCARCRVRAAGRRYVVRARPGRWRAVVRFDGANGWADQRITTRAVRVR